MSALAWPFVVINRKCVQLNSNSELLDGYKKSLVYSGSSRRVKTEEYKDHRLYRATPPAMDISIAFYFSSFLLIVSLLFGLVLC